MPPCFLRTVLLLSEPLSRNIQVTPCLAPPPCLLLFPLPRNSAPSPLTPPCSAEHILEKSLHRSVLKPLRPILAARLRRRLSADGSLGRLAEGLRLARAQGPGAFGSHLSLPSPAETEQVRQKLLQLLRTYSPSAQVKRLLQACKLLYTALRTHVGMAPSLRPLSCPTPSEAGPPGREGSDPPYFSGETEAHRGERPAPSSWLLGHPTV